MKLSVSKAANYTLAPGREYEGSWHMEGMPHERIVASVIYYYDTDSAIEDGGLSFRKFRDDRNDWPKTDMGDSRYNHEDFYLHFKDEDKRSADWQDPNYPSDWETESNDDGRHSPVDTSFGMRPFIELGTVPTTNFNSGTNNGTGRMLSFPNWLQHKVGSVKNTSLNSGDPVATRKILCFFLVDDTIQNEDLMIYHGFGLRGLGSMNVLTTSEVPCKCANAMKPRC
ncbi:hypothetical protein BT96DRAFT_159707 [Gymnopus androsaceus JB14]|uniref:DUF4246 domain-containing protein n=1 Tax=Gymnopus androsaceus JB14 TaxID=1447944 RepID=A0A6A4HDR3_9AGAR|nr:hypothetical protein BT96DRAFT_159707 [Gymnopus androsaceus JB14]